MHPHLWTVPVIGFKIGTYGFVMAVGFVIALLIARRRAKFAGLSPSGMTTLTLIGMASGLAGAPLMYFRHYGFFGGREIIGGVLLGIACSIAYLMLTRKSVLGYLDAAIPPLILAMGIGRIGCVMFGCCWGAASQTDSGEKSLAWAIHFPYMSPAYIKQMDRGELVVPSALMWKVPKQTEKEPIPTRALGLDIDSDKAINAWALAGIEFKRARNNNPGGAKFAAISKSFADAKKSVRQRDPLALVAAAHLASLHTRSATSDITWQNLRDLAKQQHSVWVHPTQVYDFIALVLLFIVLSQIFWSRPRQGMVLAWAMILYPINRVLQEMIRSDNPHDMFGMTISQFASVGILACGIGMGLWLAGSKPRS